MTPDHLTGLILENSHPPLLCYEPLAGQEQRYAPVRNCTMPVCAFWIGMVSASGQRLVPTEDEEDDSMAWVISQVIVNAEDLLGSIRVAVFGYYDAERFDPGARAVVGSDRRGPV
ncbi:MAG: hypothetical protein FJX77_15965, partial [Armatimonadetes bacterium]|nr:hypothetical protein [Armatimonadota bacterium]